MSATKTCQRCGRTLPLDAFNRNRKAKDGLDHQCRECRHKSDRQRRQAKWAERSAKSEHTDAEVRGLSSFLASLDPDGPHTATWWRQAARDGGMRDVRQGVRAVHEAPEALPRVLCKNERKRR